MGVSGVDCRVGSVVECVAVCGLDRSGLSGWSIFSVARLGTVTGRLRGCVLLLWVVQMFAVVVH